MSDETFRTRVSGSLSLRAFDGSCTIVVDDGSGKALTSKDPKGALHAEELEKVRKAAYKQGFDDCQRKMAGEVANLNLQVDEARRRVPEALNSYLADLEIQMRGEIIELAFKAAEAIVGSEVERRDITMESIHAALSPLLSTSGIKIHVSPSFLAKGIATPPAGASFVADPKLKSGEIMVDSQQGMIDGTISSRLDTLKEEILKTLSREPGDV